MKFRCPDCRTTYRIDDNRVRGHILTIRCRRCRHPFKLSDGDASLAAVTTTPWDAAARAADLDRDVTAALDRICAIDVPDQSPPWTGAPANDTPIAPGNPWRLWEPAAARAEVLAPDASDFSIDIDESAIDAIMPHRPALGFPKAPERRGLYAVAAVLATVAFAGIVVSIVLDHRTAAEARSREVAAAPDIPWVPRDIVVLIDSATGAPAANAGGDAVDFIVTGDPAGDEARARRAQRGRVSDSPLEDFEERARVELARSLRANPTAVPDVKIALKPVTKVASLAGDALGAPISPVSIATAPAPRRIGAPRRAPANPDAHATQALATYRARYSRTVEDCYISARKLDPSISGHAVVTMTIDEEGRVASLRFSDLDNTVFTRCVRDAAANWRFPLTPSDTKVEFSLNLVNL